MRSRMVVHDADADLFEATLVKAVEAGILKGKLTAIIARGALWGPSMYSTSLSHFRSGRLRSGRSEAQRSAVEPYQGCALTD